jgi:hypothetical protein
LTSNISHRFNISIVFSDAYLGWCLEIIDEYSMAHGWAAVFDTEDEALEAATIAFNTDGAAGFLQP